MVRVRRDTKPAKARVEKQWGLNPSNVAIPTNLGFCPPITFESDPHLRHYNGRFKWLWARPHAKNRGPHPLGIGVWAVPRTLPWRSGSARSIQHTLSRTITAGNAKDRVLGVATDVTFCRDLHLTVAFYRTNVLAICQRQGINHICNSISQETIQSPGRGESSYRVGGGREKATRSEEGATPYRIKGLVPPVDGVTRS